MAVAVIKTVFVRWQWLPTATRALFCIVAPPPVGRLPERARFASTPHVGRSFRRRSLVAGADRSNSRRCTRCSRSGTVDASAAAEATTTTESNRSCRGSSGKLIFSVSLPPSCGFLFGASSTERTGAKRVRRAVRNYLENYAPAPHRRLGRGRGKCVLRF